MTTILIIIHIVVCLFMVVIVLLQHGKGADIGATFGGSSQSLFGTEGPVPLMNKVTTAAAVIFMLTSISLAYLSSHQGTGSVMQEYSTPAPPPAAETKNASEPAPLAEPKPAQGTEEPAPAEFPTEKTPQAASGTEQPAPPAAAKGAGQAAKAAGGQQEHKQEQKN
jgi:preprotein translocase subunit SecG